MLKVGITGGIGSGKSTVSAVFEVLGVPVYYADEASKKLMNEDPILKEKIILHFGQEAYVKGLLNRPYLSALVFNNPERLQLLNSIVHPATLHDAAAWMLRQNAPYAIKEAALIFESGAQEQLDKVIGVSAPEALRIHRVMQRDGVSREDVQARMNRQISATIKMKLCDFVLANDGQQLLLPQIMELHGTLLQLANASLH